jgi:hypothetical protein
MKHREVTMVRIYCTEGEHVMKKLLARLHEAERLIPSGVEGLIMRHTFMSITLALSLAPLFQPAQAADTRQLVTMPPPMQEHMLANMRDHLAAIGEIQAALAAGEFDKAGEIAEQRIGMSALQAHGAEHMAPYMPEGMREIGTAMHHAASRFARVAQEASLDNNLRAPLGALAELAQQCVACHAGYRLR